MRLSEAENGAAALQFVKEQEFDTVLADIEMPQMNGLKFLAYVRSLGQMTPLVVLNLPVRRSLTRVRSSFFGSI